MANYFYKGKEVRSRSDRDRDVNLSWAHTVTLKHTDINFRDLTDSVARSVRKSLTHSVKPQIGICVKLHVGLFSR